MNITPLVSIIIPVYNGSDYLRFAIDSALAQTYQNIEVLVINDGSKDDGKTESIALSYGDRIRYFPKPNGGVASALNLGITQMKGDYFSWLSHDDVYYPDKVSSQIEYLGTLADKDVILFSDYDMINSEGKITNEIVLKEIPKDEMYPYLYLNHSIHGCSLLIPRKAFETVGNFPEHLPTTQDYDLWLRMIPIFPFIKVSKKLIQSRQHEQQGSRKIKTHLSHVSDLYLRHLKGVLSYPDLMKPNHDNTDQKIKILSNVVSFCLQPSFLKTGIKLHLLGANIIGISPFNIALLNQTYLMTIKRYILHMIRRMVRVIRYGN